MATHGPDSEQSTDEHLKAIREHLLRIRLSVGILVWIAAGGLLLAAVLAFNTID